MAWLAGWTRRKIKVVNLTVPDYQMKLIVHQSGLGPDTSTDIYLGGYIRSDFADLRFTGPDQTTLLSYWIESIVSGVAIVWVKVPTLTPTNNIYVYYDNPIALSISDGTNTFDFFDDFESGNLSKWTTFGTTQTRTFDSITSISGNSLKLDYPASGNAGIQSVGQLSMGTGKVLEFWWRTNTTASYPIATFGIFVQNGGMVVYSGSGGLGFGKNVNQMYAGGIDYSVTPGRTYVANKWYKVKVYEYDSNIRITYIDSDGSTVLWNDIVSYTYSRTSGYTTIQQSGGGAHILWVDNIFVRKYASPEPTFGISGTEELNVTATDMILDKTSCAGPCTINAYVTWHNYGNTDITSFTTAVLIDGTTLAYGAPISIPAGGDASSGAITTPTLSLGSHTICPYPN